MVFSVSGVYYRFWGVIFIVEGFLEWFIGGLVGIMQGLISMIGSGLGGYYFIGSFKLSVDEGLFELLLYDMSVSVLYLYDFQFCKQRG